MSEALHSWILVTNDDGADSPALPPLLRRLEGIATVDTLVPADECSWTSKIVSRFSPLTLAERHDEGTAVRTLTGFPADCANIGVNNLHPSPPELLISGINVGTNAGLAFFLSSGTVGAAVEATLSGVPAVAFSMEIEKEQYANWRRERRMEGMEERWAAAATVAAEVVREVLEAGLPEGASMMSVNMPPDVTPHTPRRLTGLTETRYGGVFRREEATGRFCHAYQGVTRVGGDDGDVEVLARGEVAMTPIRFALALDPTSRDRRRFERGRSGRD